MAASGLLVAAVAVPVALVARALRPRGEPLLPRWKPWRVPWGGVEALLAFLAMGVAGFATDIVLSTSGFYQVVYGPNFAPPPERADGAQGGSGPQDEARAREREQRRQEASNRHALWSGLLSLPPLVALYWFVARAIYPNWKASLIGRGSLAGKVWLAVVAWLVVTPPVLAFNAAVNELFKHFGVAPEEHSLTKAAGGPWLDRVLLVVGVSVTAPVVEELFFRGILLPWCVGRSKLLAPGVAPPSAWRPWLVMAAAGLLAASPSAGRSVAPVLFVGVLAVGLAVLWRFQRAGARRARAVYATAAMFAAAHSAVWPTPIPLFALGLALGWLAVRTNGILVPVLVHGLFNAVSAAYILRS
jgi:membrane protease YdiL (CAAX protease family)